jgi:hypothetical protein
MMSGVRPESRSSGAGLIVARNSGAFALIFCASAITSRKPCSAGTTSRGVYNAGRRGNLRLRFSPPRRSFGRVLEPPARTRIGKPACRGLLRQSIETDYTHLDSVSVACPNFLDEIPATIRTDLLNKRSPRNELELPRNPGVAFPSANQCHHQSPFGLKFDDRCGGVRKLK